MFLPILYNAALKVISFFLPVLALRDRKLKHFLNSRKEFFKSRIPAKKENSTRIWMHCASLGEFEQGKPVLQLLRAKYPSLEIVLSFFSPSGFDVIKADKLIDHVIYIPLDHKKEASQFITSLAPDLVLFVKYDFWYNHLKVLVDRKIPTVFLSVILHKDHLLQKSYAVFIRNILKRIDHIFVQDKNSFELFIKMGFKNLTLTGDTRVDSSIENTKMDFDDPVVNHFLNDERKCIIAGSVWEKDLGLIASLSDKILSSYKWIIVPHEIDESMIGVIENTFDEKECIFYSKGIGDNDVNILVIDQKGILKYLYYYAFLAYIGGGFGVGIHNTLEPAAFSLPVIIGPENKKFIEAKVLVGEGGFFEVDNLSSFERILKEMEDQGKYLTAKNIVIAYIEENKNASRLVMNYLEQFWNNDHYENFA